MLPSGLAEAQRNLEKKPQRAGYQKRHSCFNGAVSRPTESSAIVRAWRAVLPPSVRVAAGPALDEAPLLAPIERASAGAVDAWRIRELENGRAYAKHALSLLGFPDVTLPIRSGRSPQWPAGVVGSLTHSMGQDESQFAAAVAGAENVRAIGIDIEHEENVLPSTWSHFLTTLELERILALPVPDRSPAAVTAWCAKEAVIKAARRPINPLAFEIDHDQKNEEFAIRGAASAIPASPAVRWWGRAARLEKFALAAVVISKRLC